MQTKKQVTNFVVANKTWEHHSLSLSLKINSFLSLSLSLRPQWEFVLLTLTAGPIEFDNFFNLQGLCDSCLNKELIFHFYLMQYYFSLFFFFWISFRFYTFFFTIRSFFNNIYILKSNYFQWNHKHIIISINLSH